MLKQQRGIAVELMTRLGATEVYCGEHVMALLFRNLQGDQALKSSFHARPGSATELDG